jgi:hypothetical protein
MEKPLGKVHKRDKKRRRNVNIRARKVGLVRTEGGINKTSRDRA